MSQPASAELHPPLPPVSFAGSDSTIPPAQHQHLPDEASFWPSLRLERLDRELRAQGNTVSITLLDPSTFRADVLRYAALEPTDAGLLARLRRCKQERSAELQQAMSRAAVEIAAFAKPMPGTQETARADLQSLLAFVSMESLARFCGVDTTSLLDVASANTTPTAAMAVAQTQASSPQSQSQSRPESTSPSTLPTTSAGAGAGATATATATAGATGTLSPPQTPPLVHTPSSSPTHNSTTSETLGSSHSRKRRRSSPSTPTSPSSSNPDPSQANSPTVSNCRKRAKIYGTSTIIEKADSGIQGRQAAAPTLAPESGFPAENAILAGLQTEEVETAVSHTVQVDMLPLSSAHQDDTSKINGSIYAGSELDDLPHVSLPQASKSNADANAFLQPSKQKIEGG